MKLCHQVSSQLRERRAVGAVSPRCCFILVRPSRLFSANTCTSLVLRCPSWNTCVSDSARPESPGASHVQIRLDQFIAGPKVATRECGTSWRVSRVRYGYERGVAGSMCGRDFADTTVADSFMKEQWLYVLLDLY
ncbi:hypothetical protein K437DRAFT_254746, partial [Tilletiaria anomala UBC 951]